MPVILAAQEAEIRRISVQSQPEKIVFETLSRGKNTTQKRDGGLAQVIECLLSKCKTLSSNANATTKKIGKSGVLILILLSIVFWGKKSLNGKTSRIEVSANLQSENVSTKYSSLGTKNNNLKPTVPLTELSAHLNLQPHV
jgi:hypothetical protein